jgi:hypothetical protein
MSKHSTSYIPYIEETLESKPELSKKFIVHTYVELREGDLIQCTYLKPVHKVVKVISPDKITISPVDNPSAKYTVSSKFIRLYEGNSKAVKVLFES